MAAPLTGLTSHINPRHIPELFFLFYAGESVSREVRSIMNSPLPTVSYNTKSRSFQSSQPFSTLLPRREKRRSKSSLALAKYGGSKKGKTQVSTFQRKLVVFNYMGGDSPTHFIRKDQYIIMRGLLPEISVDASEEEVRKDICDIIRSCSEYDVSLCGLYDFEFIDMNGKHASVPNVKEGLKFTGKAVKNLAGSGCVYVRMTSDLFTTVLSSDSSDDLPNVDASKSEENASGSRCSSNVRQSSKRLSCDIRQTSLSHALATEGGEGSSSFASSTQGCASHTHTRSLSGGQRSSSGTPTIRSLLSSGSLTTEMGRNSPTCSVTSEIVQVLSSAQGSSSSASEMERESSTGGLSHDVDQYSLPCSESDPGSSSVTGTSELTEHCVGSAVSQLCDVLPNFSQDIVKFVYAESGEHFMNAMNCLLEGPTLESIRSLLKLSRIISPIADSPRIRLDEDDNDDDWVSAAIAHYKSPEFDPKAEVRICMRGQPAIDTGGVRRQFFSVVFKTLAHSEKFSMFDGPADRLRPAFRMSNLSSGMFRVLGQMVAHSFILDGQGFPYLSECLYYYLAGLTDRAMTLVTVADLSEQVKTLVGEVHCDCFWTIVITSKLLLNSMKFLIALTGWVY